MTDVHTPQQRSYNMQQMKGKNTKTEMMVRKFLRANGYRYKLHNKKLPGKPDIVLPAMLTTTPILKISDLFYYIAVRINNKYGRN